MLMHPICNTLLLILPAIAVTSVEGDLRNSLTIIPGRHLPNPHPLTGAVDDVDQLFRHSCPPQYIESQTDIIASSFDHWDFTTSQIHSSSASFIRSAIEAWGYHSHLVLRPDDLWFTILTQMSFYMQSRSNEVRHIFVSHSGKQKVVIEDWSWPRVIGGFRDCIQSRIKTKWMADWVSPGFSTSTEDDELTATVLTMGSMKAYFDFAGGIVCGIPSITLLGKKQDWERLQLKVDRIKDFGKDAASYRKRLKPLLARIVASFDDPKSQETRNFWDEMVQAKPRHSNMCGEPPLQYRVSGWILGFYYWNQDGKRNANLADGKNGYRPGSLRYDGITYGEIALEEIPQGYATAGFTMLNEHKGPNSSQPREGFVVAGNIGKQVIPGAPKGYRAALLEQHVDIATSDGLDGSTIQPLSGWFLAAPLSEIGVESRKNKAELKRPTVDAIEACDMRVHEEL